MNTISFMTANYCARAVGWNMTEGWMQGQNATDAHFKPLDTYARRFEEYLTDIKAMGFDALDLWLPLLNPVWATEDHVRLAVDLLHTHGLTVVSLAGGFGNTREEFERVCQIAAAVGAPVLGGGTGLASSDRAFMVDTLKQYGLKWGFENHPEKTPAEILEKIGGDEGGVVGVCVDTGWFGTQGYDAPKGLEELAHRLVHVHLKDVKTAGGHETCRFGEGVVGIEACVQTLRRIGYTGALSVEHEPEHFDPTDDIRASYALLRQWLAS
jgi:sugar phosphate isomerase/epimerase